MKTHTLLTLGWLIPAALVACATNHPKVADTAGKVTPQMRSGSNELRTYQLVEWIAPDDRTLIVNADHRLHPSNATAGREVRRGRPPGWKTLCIHIHYAARDRTRSRQGRSSNR